MVTSWVGHFEVFLSMEAAFVILVQKALQLILVACILDSHVLSQDEKNYGIIQHVTLDSSLFFQIPIVLLLLF